MKLKKYFGDRAFYRMVLTVAVPIMVQNGVTNLVNMLDNIMVGSLGTEQMSGVSIVNQFTFIFNLLVFGAVSAAGIFTAQYYGLGNKEGVRDTFRFKLLINLMIGVVGIGVFWLAGDALIGIFLHEGSAEGDLAKTLAFGQEYIAVMLIGLIPFALAQVYASTMRETGENMMPMIASIIAVVVNFIFNTILIFGTFGAPALGVKGAAIATVISRFVELAVLVIYAHTHGAKCEFAVGAFRTLKIPTRLAGQIALKGLPLMLNEFFWALAVTMRNQCYSTRGLDAVAAQNIDATLINLFSVIYLSLGTAIAIIVGRLLGAGKIEEAKDTDRKMITFSVLCSFAMSVLLVGIAFLFPLLYNTTSSAREIATYMILISGLLMPFNAFSNAAYFTLRSGGQVMITVLFDSVYMWGVVLPTSFLLTHLTGMDIRWLFLACQAVESVKFIPGIFYLRRGTWANQLVTEEETPEELDSLLNQ